jgi:AraC family transcriptional regulator
VVTTYIEEHLAEPIPLATLAAMMWLSPYYFCRAFKRSVGMPAHHYHMTRRVEWSKMRLAEGKHSITDIARMVGYSDSSSFTRALRRVTGITPSTYRRTLIWARVSPIG